MSQITVTAEMKKKFDEEGFLYIDQPLFSDSDYLNLKKYMLSFILSLPKEMRPLYFTSNPDYRPLIADWVASPPLLNLAETFLGPDIVFFNIAGCYKPPHSDYRVSVHTDAHYWHINKMIDPVEVFILFIPFSDMTKESGCLRVLPRQTAHRTYHYKEVDKYKNYFGFEIEDKDVDPTKMIDLEMKENRVCLLKEDLIHCSEKNTTDEHRLGITLRYISAKTKYLAHPMDINRRMYLLKGRNLQGLDYADIHSLQKIGGFSWSTE
ncbi:MAG: hypothetical protein K0R29_1250 [Pseudobdellovibrio sp.]|jgi:hypothetical protein|nr:hypothetical protein [Pseudobdellovibrio sp.]